VKIFKEKENNFFENLVRFGYGHLQVSIKVENRYVI